MDVSDEVATFSPTRPLRSEIGSLLIELAILLIISLSIVVRQFNNPHFASCVTDDSILQISWVRQFVQGLNEAVWLPRWLPDSNGGYGSPVFIFYSPLVYYVTAFLYWGTGSVILAMKLVRFLGLFLSGLTMFIYARGLTGRKTALLVAVVYLVIPFHVLDISYWTLLAETWAWIWFPLILISLRQLVELKGRVPLVFFSLSYAGLVLTHLVSAYMFSFVILSYVVFCSERNQLLENLKKMWVGALLALGLVAFFIVPAFYERRFIHLEYSTLLPEFDFRNTYLFFPNTNLTQANPFQAKTIAILQALTIMQGMWVLLGAGLNFQNHSITRPLRRELSFALVIAVLCLFLMSQLSTWIWEWVPGLPQIQFSTRWLSIYTFAAALLIGAGFETYRYQYQGARKWLKLGHLSGVFLAGLGSVLIILGGCFINSEHQRLAQESVYNAPEYNPLVMPNWKQRIIYPGSPRVSVLEGVAKVHVDQWKAHYRELRVEADTSIRLQLRLLSYPGWIVTQDEKIVPISVDQATGGMLMDIPQGKHLLKIEFKNTWWRKACTFISGLCALVLMGLLMIRPDRR